MTIRKHPDNLRSKIHWWDRMSYSQQKEYKSKHPDSRFIVGKYAKECKKPRK